MRLRGRRTVRLARPRLAPAGGLAPRCAGRVGVRSSAWWRRYRRAVRRGTRPGVPPFFEESVVPLEGVVEPGGLHQRGDGLARVRGDLDDPVGQPGASSLLDRPDVLPGDGPSTKTTDSDGVRRQVDAQRPELPRACRAGAAEAQAQPTEPRSHPAVRGQRRYAEPELGGGQDEQARPRRRWGGERGASLAGTSSGHAWNLSDRSSLRPGYWCSAGAVVDDDAVTTPCGGAQTLARHRMPPRLAAPPSACSCEFGCLPIGKRRTEGWTPLYHRSEPPCAGRPRPPTSTEARLPPMRRLLPLKGN